MNRYRELLGVPHVKILVMSALPARIAYGMVSLSIFFKATHETNSIPLAGLAIGLNSLSGALTAGARGSLMDTYGQKWPLRIQVPAYSAMLIMLNLMHGRQSILLIAFLLGMTAPPINLSVRPLWRSIIDDRLLRTAYALDTSFINAASVIGPIFATMLSLSSHPGAALLVCSALMLIGGGSLGLTTVSKSWIPEVKEKGSRPLWRNPAMQLLMLEGCFIGFGWGAFNVGVPAFSTLEHVPHRTAWILGTMGIFNIIGGLLGGLVSKKSSSLNSLLKAYALWFVFTLPLAFTYPGWSLAIAGAFLGLCGGAIQVFYWEVMEAVRPLGSATSAMGWLWTVEGSLMAIGSAVGGWIAKEISPRMCFGITTVSVGFGLLILTIGRKRLSAANRIPTDKEDLQAMEDNASPAQ
ncbi:MAG: MFS transporter [Candidatus Nanopelagicaceae bacterium]|nr:MFS transporter [Candidatus Nanopelagicaceae bacterium]